jgi:hypothetical protein
MSAMFSRCSNDEQCPQNADILLIHNTSKECRRLASDILKDGKRLIDKEDCTRSRSCTREDDQRHSASACLEVWIAGCLGMPALGGLVVAGCGALPHESCPNVLRPTSFNWTER